uniref:Transposase n=1 Tax=Streptococcus suis TaxID=1307 RepID=G8DU24_STRSU|nr:transposase [Streptococcus suis]
MKLIFPFLKPYSSHLIFSGNQFQSVLNWNSFSLRITVEVETTRRLAIAVIDCFSMRS